MSFNDSLFSLTSREKKMLEKSWAKTFAEEIFPYIDESPFAVLYSDKASRPNTPVNVMISALILKEVFQMDDDEILQSLLFDIRFQYAMNTTNFEEQPMSDKTLCRFRRRVYTYEAETGIDLIHQTITKLSARIAKYMNVSGQIKRMDSMMISSNIKRLSRLELLYTCLSNFVVYLHKNKHDDLIKDIMHYCESDDYNKVVYHNKSEGTDKKIATILSDASKLLLQCEGSYDNVLEYQLLIRVIGEQAIQNDDGSLRLKTPEDGAMGADILQNPSDPDATYREKAGKANRGYAANLTESVSDYKSVVTDYQFEQNTHSDVEFLSEELDRLEKTPGKTHMVTDGGYASEDLKEKASAKNIDLVTTDLLGKDTPDIYADFEFSEDGKEVLSCPNGIKPTKSTYSEKTGKCKANFSKHTCDSCPFHDQCNPKGSNKTATVYVSFKQKSRALSQREMKTDAFKIISRIRNGVETLPSTLRRKYHVDHMPVRGKIRMKHLFGFKVGALNFKKLLKYVSSSDNYTLNPVNA